MQFFFSTLPSGNLTRKLHSSLSIAAAFTVVTGVQLAESRAQSLDGIQFEQKLSAYDGARFDRFGQAVAVSESHLVVGAYNDDDAGSKSGSAYVYDWLSGNLTYKLTPEDLEVGDEFGIAVATHGNHCVVGAVNHLGHGAAYVYDLNNGLMIHKLTAPVPRAGDEFGQAVAINQSRIAVGAWKSEGAEDADSFDSGSVFVYDLNTGDFLHQLQPQDVSQFDQFGGAVAFCTDCVVVGSPFDDTSAADTGSAYVFSSTGTQLRRIVPADAAEGDVFGSSLSSHDDIVLIGAPERDDMGDSSGAAYLYHASTGSFRAKLLPDDGAAGDRFGNAVAIGAAILVGSFRNDAGATDTGATYLFSKTGALLRKVTAPDAASSDFFGQSVAANGVCFFAGALQDDDNGSASGSAYRFDFDEALRLNVEGGNVRLTWNSIPGATYEVRTSTSVNFTGSYLLPDSNQVADDFAETYDHRGGALLDASFYKLITR